jgi:hypothetical protein
MASGGPRLGHSIPSGERSDGSIGGDLVDHDNETWVAHPGGNAAEALRHPIEGRPFGREVLVA